MGEIEIREVLPGEYEDTGGLTQRAYAEYARPGDPLWDNYFGVLADVAGRAGFATVLVAVAGGRIIGTATVELDCTIDGTGGLQPGQTNLRLLAVDPGARGRGVGRLLVEACVQVARRAGKEIVTLHPGPKAQVSMAGAACAVTCLTGQACGPDHRGAAGPEVRDDACTRMDPAHSGAHLRLWIDVVRRAEGGCLAAGLFDEVLQGGGGQGSGAPADPGLAAQHVIGAVEGPDQAGEAGRDDVVGEEGNADPVGGQGGRRPWGSDRSRCLLVAGPCHAARDRGWARCRLLAAYLAAVFR
jgi:GNAT superfamily N-acetyltransferase